MRIAFFVNQFPAISETFILNQITGLIDRGHSVDIYADHPSSPTKVHPDVERYNLVARTRYFPKMPRSWILRLIKAPGLFLANAHKNPILLLKTINALKYGRYAASLRLFYRVIPLLKQEEYDIIHCHFGSIGLIAKSLRDVGAIRGKLITAFHGIDITMFVKLFGSDVYKELFEAGELFLPISDCWRNRLVELGCDTSKILVHRMGIDCGKFTFISRRLDDGEVIKIVTIARLVEKKGVEFAIRAVAKLMKTAPNVEYTIIGDGPLKQNLQELICQLNVGKAVQIFGWKQQQEVIEILNESHILLMPSVTATNGDQEGIPVTGMEAMATGMPIIGTHHSGIPELIQDEVSGFLVPERDTEALVERLNYLVQYSEQWCEMGKAGRAFVEKNYDINKLNDQLVKIYQELLKQAN